MENRKVVNILGVSVDNITMSEALDKVEQWLKKDGKRYVVTPNPEFIMAAQKDEEFKEVLNNADLAIPDGVGLKIGSDIQSTIPGVDFLEELVKMSSKKGFTTGFLGGRDSVAKKAAECLQKKYPGLRVVFADDGPEVDIMGNGVSSKYYGKKQEQKPIIHNTYPISQVDILFVGFGQVKQEKWIAENLPNLPVKVAMGVGGSFDYLSGQVARAPKWMRKLGLEWLFRLIIQPWRIKRQLALIKFIWNIMISK